MKNRYLLGLDIGSSSVKASLVDADTGCCISDAFYPPTEAPIISKRPGWAEQNPEDWWEYLVNAVRKTVSGNSPEVVAIGISYQMHGLVCIGKDYRPLRPAIIWCDSRAVPYGEKALNAAGRQKCMETLLNSPGNFTASKLSWVKENEAAIFEKIWKIMLPGDYIAMKLTGNVCTTASGLSEGMLWDFRQNCPANFLMDCMGFRQDILPDILPTFSDQGRLCREAASLLGLKAGIPVTYRAGDQPNNALSLNVLRPGEIASTAGTSGVVYGVGDKVAYDPLSRVNTFAHVNHTADNPRLGVLLCINGTGILNSWIRRNVTPDLSYSEMNALASQAPIGSRSLSVLPFGNGAERILENKEPGCRIAGLNFNTHGRADLLRAVQEGIVFSFQYGMEIMKEMGLEIKKIRAGKANMFLSEPFRTTLASVSGASIELMATDGAAGAARGAGIGAGIYANAEEAFETLNVLEVTEPDTADAGEYIEAYERWKSILKETNN